jgi:predicted NBD/HSP70 family sugar kinase
VVIETAASALGLEIARLVHATDPGLIVLGGGLGLNERYRALVEAAVGASIDSTYANAPRVVSAALRENVGIIGAALAAI